MPYLEERTMGRTWSRPADCFNAGSHPVQETRLRDRPLHGLSRECCAHVGRLESGTRSFTRITVESLNLGRSGLSPRVYVVLNAVEETYGVGTRFGAAQMCKSSMRTTSGCACL